MVYRNKTYVAFDGDKDMRYYNLMKAWKQSDNTDFNFYDAHDLNTARDSSQEESIKRQLRERMANSKVFVLLIGESTKYLTKFVKWEIELAIKKELPIICVNLNGSRKSDNLCPNSLNEYLSIFIPFGSKIMQYALENWPTWEAKYRQNGDSGHYYYKQAVYDSLGV
ncbi:TIR domain-containing protein [Vagococcus lutrae]|uniref:TIR domain-containing protein n=1 Tax=Vagococcus lutrae TaxID=81947 RepID=UPI0023A9902E|nr:TIR domain-containing protein [Vagococcus lutrae]WEB81024.1 TIR domain-containing protein [Vagococcus lutrae]